MEGKSALRRRIIAKRDALPAQEIRRRSAAASSRLLALPEFRAARTVMFFITFGSEIETLPAVRAALADGKGVAAPRADPTSHSLQPYLIADPDADLVPGFRGIPEPRAHCPPAVLAEIGAVIVPAAAWGEDGYRVGYGGGYYDRFLARIPSAVRIGFGLEIQVVPEVPHDQDDLPVDILVTDALVRRFSHRESREEMAQAS